MISVDNRAGSAQLAPLLRQRGYPVDLTRFPFGDIAFSGVGAGGVPIGVAVEVKRLNDCLQCLQDSRFAGFQLPGLLAAYDSVWLLIVDRYRPRHRDGVLEYLYDEQRGYWRDASHGRRRSFLWHDFQQWLLTLQHRGGIRVAVVDNYDQAALWIGGLYSWWSNGLDSHGSHLQLYDGMRSELFDRALLTKPSLLRCVCAQLPNIGKEKSAAVASRFKTVESMVAASEADWVSIPGIGKTIARKVYLALRGGSNGNGGH